MIVYGIGIGIGIGIGVAFASGARTAHTWGMRLLLGLFALLVGYWLAQAVVTLRRRSLRAR